MEPTEHFGIYFGYIRRLFQSWVSPFNCGGCSPRSEAASPRSGPENSALRGPSHVLVSVEIGIFLRWWMNIEDLKWKTFDFLWNEGLGKSLFANLTYAIYEIVWKKTVFVTANIPGGGGGMSGPRSQNSVQEALGRPIYCALYFAGAVSAVWRLYNSSVVSHC